MSERMTDERLTKLEMVVMAYGDEYDKEAIQALRAERERVKELESKYCYLPRITPEITEMFEDTDLLDEHGWTQDAVDFACLLNQHQHGILSDE